MSKPLFLLITGPGGAGKTTLADMLCRRLGFTRWLSVSTRLPRAGAARPEYAHVSREEFARALVADEFVEIGMAPNGALYGLPRPSEPICGPALVAITSTIGCGTARERLAESFDVRVILVDAPDEVLLARMASRGDTEVQRRQRLILAQLERNPVGGADLRIAEDSPEAALELALKSPAVQAKFATAAPPSFFDCGLFKGTQSARCTR